MSDPSMAQTVSLLIESAQAIEYVSGVLASSSDKINKLTENVESHIMKTHPGQFTLTEYFAMLTATEALLKDTVKKALAENHPISSQMAGQLVLLNGLYRKLGDISEEFIAKLDREYREDSLCEYEGSNAR